jgi:hypothetical protein
MTLAGAITRRDCTKQRRTSFGSDSVAGSEFVSRLLTVVSSLNLQGRNILDFLIESVSASRSGAIPLASRISPSLLVKSILSPRMINDSG